MLQRASSGTLRKSCSTSTRPKIDSARPSKSARRPGSPKAVQRQRRPRPARRRPATTSAAATGNEPRRCVGASAGAAAPYRDGRFDQQQQERVPGADAQHVDDRSQPRSSTGACVSANASSRSAHAAVRPTAISQRQAAQPAARAEAQIERQRRRSRCPRAHSSRRRRS